VISLSAYKVLHLFSLSLLFTVVGGAILHAANGGERKSNTARALVGAFHGIALFLILASGFGQLARLGIEHDWLFPGWVWVKLAIWLLFAFAISLPYRKPALAPTLLWLLPLLGGVAAYFALYKPL
jgi:hypothetical protein